MTDAEILAVIGRLTFVFAKTMPEIPHEYNVRKPETVGRHQGAGRS
jgi:hypothetical protein